MKQKLSTLILSAIVLGALAGCTPSGDTPTPTGAAPATIPTIPAGSGVIDGAVIESVTADPGTTVTAEGTITMPAGRSGHVTISVSWVNGATSAVYARGVTTVRELHAGESTTWKTTAVLPGTATDVRTVLGAVIADA